MLCKLATRRAFLAASSLATIGITGCASSLAAPTALVTPVGATMTASLTPDNQTMPTSNQALQKLLDGNLRFQRSQAEWPDQTVAQRQAVAKKQTPFAIVFSCIDSRVPPELVFDQGLGDLFIIRTGAHVLDSAALGSIEFGVAELSIPLLVVLGHKRCGAVTATVDAIDHNTVAPGSIQYLVDYIRPSVLAAQGQGDVRLANAVRNNTMSTVNALSRSKIVSDAVKAGKLTVVGGGYDLDTGAVSIFPQT